MTSYEYGLWAKGCYTDIQRGPASYMETIYTMFATKRMMMPRVKHLLVAVLVVLVWPPVVLGDSIAPPYSYTKPTPNGEYIFVMISPLSAERDAGSWIEDKAKEIQVIRSAYTESGLYRNDGSKNPLWTVGWYAYNVEPLSDGIHLVRPGPWASSPKTEAVAFFSGGILLKSYTVSDIVSRPQLMPHSVSHFTWSSSEQLLDEAKQYEIRTLHEEYYLFDVTTGDIVKESRSPSTIVDSVNAYRAPRWLILAGLAVLCLLAGSLYIWTRRKRITAEQDAPADADKPRR